MLDAARVIPGVRLLDAGCGAGLLALLASLRGAQVTALDALAALLAIVRQRIPQFLTAVMLALGPLMPPPPPGASLPHPGALSQPGTLQQC